jgi:hypothetical protein
MLKDIRILLKYLIMFLDAFGVSDTDLISEKEDTKMQSEIHRIRNKYKL